MARPLPTTAPHDPPATHEDVKRVFGEIDDAKVLEIVKLRPSLLDLEEASVWLGGDRDVFGAEPPIKGAASAIVSILTADEEEEPPRAP